MKFFTDWFDKLSKPMNCKPKNPECEHTFQLTNEFFQDNRDLYPARPKFFTISICTKCGKPRRVYE